MNYLWNISYKACHISGYISNVWNVATTFCETVRENYVKLSAKYCVNYSIKIQCHVWNVEWNVAKNTTWNIAWLYFAYKL